MTLYSDSTSHRLHDKWHHYLGKNAEYDVSSIFVYIIQSYNIVRLPQMFSRQLSLVLRDRTRRVCYGCAIDTEYAQIAIQRLKVM